MQIMQAVADGIPSFAFNLGAGEIFLVFAVVLILFGAKRLPDLRRGLGLGISEFGKATRDIGREVDRGAHDAGESLGGIYGKPAAEALTPDNQTAELYDPAAFHDENEPRKRAGFWQRAWERVWSFVGSLGGRRMG